MKKKPLRLIVLIIFMSNLTSQAQSNFKSKEIYLTGQSLTMNDCGIQFKSELRDNLYLRFGLLELRAKQTNNISAQSDVFSTHVFYSKGQIQFGIEKRQAVTDKSFFFYGIDLIGQTIFQRTKTDNPFIPEDFRKADNASFETGLGIVAGYMINLKDNFYIATEIEPEFLYLYSTSENYPDNTKNKRTGFDFHLNTEIIKFSIIYKWNKGAGR